MFAASMALVPLIPYLVISGTVAFLLSLAASLGALARTERGRIKRNWIVVSAGLPV